MELNHSSKNILKVLDSIYYPSQFNFSFANIPIMDIDYTEILNKEFNVIWNKFEEVYYSARSSDSIEFFFNRYHRKIKKLLLDLEDDIYSVICKQIVKPNFYHEIYINNLYKLHEVAFALCKDFEREFEDVLADKLINSGFTTKIKYIPLYCFEEAHDDFVSKYKPGCEYVETGGIKIIITDELLEDFNKNDDVLDETMYIDDILEDLPFKNRMYNPTQDEDSLRFFFKGLLWEYIHGKASKAEKRLIKKAAHYIRNKVNRNELETGNIALDYLAFFIHTDIGGENTFGFVIQYFTERDVAVNELKTFLKVLKDLSLSKEYFNYSLSTIKPQVSNMKIEIIEFLEVRLIELEGVNEEVSKSIQNIDEKIEYTGTLESLGLLIGLMFKSELILSNDRKSKVSRVLASSFVSEENKHFSQRSIKDAFYENKRKNDDKNVIYLLDKFTQMLAILKKMKNDYNYK